MEFNLYSHKNKGFFLIKELLCIWKVPCIFFMEPYSNKEPLLLRVYIKAKSRQKLTEHFRGFHSLCLSVMMAMNEL